MKEARKIRVGIDPGKNGFIAIFEDGKYDFEPMPIIGKEYDIQELSSTFKIISEISEDVHCCLENVHAIQGAGATSNFEFGKGLGILETLLTVYKIPFTKVTPNKWQKVSWEGVPIQIKSNPKNKSGRSTDTKKTSLLAAKRLYPNIDLRADVSEKSRCRVPHDGKIDSLLILYYCLKKF